ncbi:cytochrome c maturation protein CcmE [Pseudodesulfovibrio sp.]|uniref:cytochrome c maturation protein CcmE n=1 Tax=unclassified Pseudodesulfovibrio TaxID=2661612 RepID=UPI003AFFB41D
MSKSKNKAIYAVALVLFLGGLGYLIFSGLTEDSVYFLNVSEALTHDPKTMGNARLFGKVSSDQLEIKDGKLGAKFYLIDKMQGDKQLRVAFKGALPDTFKENVEVIVEGRFAPDGQVFQARTLVTKCPSKYKEKSREMDQTKQQAAM